MNYQLHNTTRSVTTRAQRYTNPYHGGAKQIFGEKRVLRGRPVVISEEELLGSLPMLREAAAAGTLEVRLPDGRRLDLVTLQPEGYVTPTPPLPCPVLDSVANDKPSGVPMPIYPGGAVQSTQELAQEPSHEDDDPEVEYQDSGPHAPRKGKKGKR